MELDPLNFATCPNPAIVFVVLIVVPDADNVRLLDDESVNVVLPLVPSKCSNSDTLAKYGSPEEDATGLSAVLNASISSFAPL